MHDLQRPNSKVNRLLPPITAFLLLASLLLFFRKPSTTLTDLEDITNHASVLSLSDSAWSGDWWIWNGIEPPLPGCVAFGLHDLYPFRLITARDVQTGDILIRIISPLSIPSDEIGMNHFRFISFAQDSETFVLLHQQNSESWPVKLFSIITDS